MTGLEPHLEALSLILAGEAGITGRRLEQARPAPAAFLEVCAAHQLQPLLLTAFGPERIGELFGESARDRIEGYCQRQRSHQESLLEELAVLSRLLESAGVELLLLKGPYLAARFYGSVHGRFYRDLDLMVPRRQLPRVSEILEARGYRRLSTILLSERLSARFTHGFDFARGAVNLDLHWSLGVSAGYSLDGDLIWRESASFSIRGREMRVLSDDHCLMALLISCFEDLQRGVGKLKAFADIHRVVEGLQRPIDWPLFFRRRVEEGTAAPCRAVLRLFVDWLRLESRLPDLAAALGPARGASASADERLDGRRGARSHRQWASRNSGTSAAAGLRWWVVSLPFRLAVYRPGRINRFRQALRRSLGR